MALQDIINAIKAQAETDVSSIQEQTLREKDAFKKQIDAEIAAYEKELQEQTTQRKAQLEKKAQTTIVMERRKAELTEKRTALDTLYTSVAKELMALPADKMENLEKALQENIKGRDGKIEAAKDGGFIFVSINSEEDFTFPHLVESTLRPKTEIDVSAKLFA